MKLTLAKHNNDQYVILESGGKTVTYKAKTLMKTSEICYTDKEDYVYQSEVFDITFLREEKSKDESGNKGEDRPLD